MSANKPKPDSKRDAKADPKSGAAAAPSASKVDDLRSQIQQIQTEIKIFEGMLKNRRPEFTATAKKETETLRSRTDRLTLILQGMTRELLLPRDREEWRHQVDLLKSACVDACKRSNIDEALWKDIESL